MSPVSVQPDTLRRGRAPERRQLILDALRANGFQSVADLVRILGVSEMTIRRDLRELATAAAVRLVHGGASLPPGTEGPLGFAQRTARSSAAKQLIVQVALGLVADGDTIALDAGTTAYGIATALPESFHGSVVTHSVPIVQHMLQRPAVSLVCLGGDLHTSSQSFAGPLTVTICERLRVRTFFLSVTALDARGAYVRADVEGSVKRALTSIADQVVLIADHEKFTSIAPILMSSYDPIDTLITDRPPPDDAAAALSRSGVTVRIAGTQSEESG